MLRGIERGNICRFTMMRIVRIFLARLGDLPRARVCLLGTDGQLRPYPALQWSERLPVLMHRFLAAYAVAFKRRHVRYGHCTRRRRLRG